ncbi:hypothetical protein R6Q59_029070 [Mikania micrantha]
MHPPYINTNGNTSFSTINHQWATSSCYYNHEDPNFKPADYIQSTIENSDWKFGVADHNVNCINSPMILENKCLKGNKSSKKDRHSKINTARGPRDRRMRLSLDVAIKFFRLQDMLGFEKASNTIEWLLIKSKPAIKDLHLQQMNQSCSLMGVSSSPSSASECEVLSGIDDQSMEKIVEKKAIMKEKKKIQRGVRKSVYIDQSLAKETREKARARARKRTTEKKKINLDYEGYQFSKLTPSLDQVMDQNMTRLGSLIPFGENQLQLTDQAGYPSSHFQFKHGIVANSSPIPSSNWSSSFLLGYQHSSVLSHEHQFSDLQILGKPWEDINN